jgi:putative YhdH/YhfP family quinone oxidoreductase
MKYQALILEEKNGEIVLEYNEVAAAGLKDGEVRVKVQYSGINYKDRLAVNPESRVVRSYPMVPGIDFSGIVHESRSSDFSVGEAVFLTGQGYGTDRFGGYQEFVTVKSEEISRLPQGLTTREAMIYGTAGLTAALSVDALMLDGGTPYRETDILVTGGTGGVSSHAIMILHKLGCRVTASSRSADYAEYLKTLGASEVLLFQSLLEKRKALSREKWDGVVDATGGAALGNLLTEIRYGGVLAASGNLSGISFESTVFPFILRGITLKGIDSVYVTGAKKAEMFEKLGRDWKSDHLEKVVAREVSFGELKRELMSENSGKGRVLVVYP